MTLKKKLAAALAAAGLAAGLSLAWPGTARATDIPPVGQWAEIFNPYLHAQGNTLCFDDPNGSTSDGTRAQLYRCHGYASNGAPQRWVFIQAEDRDGNPITEGGNNVYELGPNDVVTGAPGGWGNLYKFATGDGLVTINPGSADTIQMAAGILPSDVMLSPTIFLRFLNAWMP